MDNRQMVLREIPKIDELLMDEQLIFFMETTPRAVVVDAAREVIEEIRKDALAGTRTEVPKREAIVEEICRTYSEQPPRRVPLSQQKFACSSSSTEWAQRISNARCSFPSPSSVHPKHGCSASIPRGFFKYSVLRFTACNMFFSSFMRL